MNFKGKTDIGRKREKNEDLFIAERIADDAVLLAVFDGMGGEAGGDIASHTAAASFLSEIKYQAESRLRGGRLYFAEPELEVPMLLDSAAANANFEVWQKAQDNKALYGMGTTCAAALIFEDTGELYIINIGDSRIYRINEANAERLTKDHSYVQYLVDLGEITQMEADTRSDKNIITRALGISLRAEVDIKKEAIKKGETLLLCSDGLYDMLTDDELSGVASFSGAALDKRVDKLVSLANDAGGEDNITVILAEI